VSIFGSDSEIVAAAEAAARPPDEPPPPRAPRRVPWRSLARWALVALIAVVLAIVVRTFVAQFYGVPSTSMSPAIERGDRIVVDKLSYHLHEIRRGDVVVFARPAEAVDVYADGETDDLVKRVIGVPGETLVIRDDHVEIDGQRLDEPWLAPGTVTRVWDREKHYAHDCTPDDPCPIPAGTVWVMGDNRTGSQDSRYFGPVAEDQVLGRAVAVFWPWSHHHGL
jgi:signal peptidase I